MQGYIHASYHVAEMAVFEHCEYSFFLHIFQVFCVVWFSLYAWSHRLFETWLVNGWFKVDFVGDVYALLPALRQCNLNRFFSTDLIICSDSVTRVHDSTRLTIFGDSDSTRVTLIKWWLDSRFSQNDSTRVTVNDSSQSLFYKISEFLIDKPTSCALLKEMSIFCFSDDQALRKFSDLLVWSFYATF